MSSHTEPKRGTARLGSALGKVLTGSPGRELNLFGLVLLVWGLVASGDLGLHGRHLGVLVLSAVAVAAWLVEVSFDRPQHQALVVVALVVLAVGGGVVAAFVPLGIVFVGVAGLLAAIRLDALPALGIACLGPTTLAVAGSVVGTAPATMVGGAAAALAGLVLGLSRRRSLERAEQEALVTVARERAEIERARAELLSERNHLAREIHDVLAHSLSALSIKLEALSVAVEDGTAGRPELATEIDELRRLVRSGLAEARRAVGALRDDAGPITEQLEALCAGHHASFVATGEARPLAPAVALSLYRIAQEALTNAEKHAPGENVEVRLGFGEGRVAVSVVNRLPADTPAGWLATSGGGFGLEGIRERVRLSGGHVEAGRSGDWWRVEAEVPA